MATYLLTTDPNTIDFGHRDLHTRVESFLGTPVAVYRPYTFVEHTGFSETVREEIQLVLINQPAGQPPRLDFDAFVDSWGFGEHLDARVLDLSGGWRKYLGLALFMNRPLTARLLFDTTSHLSDARMRTLLADAERDGDVVFCEYDPALLQRLHPSMHRLDDDGVRVARS